MSFAVSFLTAAMTALVLENVLFARSLGSSLMLYLIRRPREILPFAAVMTGVCVSAGLICYPLRAPVSKLGYDYVAQPILYILCVVLVYALAYVLLSRFAPKAFEKLSGSLAAGSFNCAVLGALLIPANESMDLARTLGYGIGASLGFVGAVVLIGLGIRRLELCHIPKAFKGLPILLIYIGLLSLALYGLIGHQLPT